jgi:hypothetical protein
MISEAKGLITGPAWYPGFRKRQRHARVVRHITQHNIFLDRGAITVYHGKAIVNGNCVAVHSIDKEIWQVSIKEDGKILLDSCMPGLTEREQIALEWQGYIY